MLAKVKGTNAERELVRLFWEAGWAAIRSAGSGSMQFPSPDILAGNGFRRVAIEAKITKESKKYFTNSEIKQIQNFSGYFGAEPWIAIKFPGFSWVFITPEDLRTSGENLVFSTDDVEKKGIAFAELIEFNYKGQKEA
jgi:Holliday junction resolvase